MADLADAHRAIIRDVAARIETIEAEIQRLRAVLGYHTEALSALVDHSGNGKAVSGRVIASSKPPTENVEKAAETTKLTEKVPLLRDQCAWALHKIGGRGKTAGVAQVLIDAKVGNIHLKKVSTVQAMVFTAMSRATDMFEKVGRGEWQLKAGP